MARPTIGFLINDLASTYQYELWCGVDAACRERGLELVVFTGGEIGSDDPVKAVRNRVFNLANARNVQGLVVGAPAVGNYLTHDQAADYCRALGLPVVTIGIELPGIPAVLVDNTAGMQRLVEHLVVDHGRRKIAFVGGSVENPEAQARLQAYRDVLARHGLGPDPTLEVVANWDHGFATHLTLELIRNVPGLDAVVAANDDMALGAMEAVKKAGLSSPHDITICGFDDIEDARFSSPTLSTVRQPMGEQGRHAVDMVLQLIDRKSAGNAAPAVQVKYLPADFVPRKSCGCVSDELMHAFLRPDSVQTLETPPADAALEADLAASIAAHAPDIVEEDRQAIVHALVEDVRESKCEGSFQAFEKVIRATPFQSEKLLALQSLVNSEREAMLPSVARRGAPEIAAESIWHQKRMMIAEAAVGAEAYQRVQHERLVRVLQVMSAQLTTTFNIDALLSQLRYHLPLIGISTAYLLLECDGDSCGDDNKPLRLMMAIEEGRPLPMPEEGLRVRPGSLFPEGYVRAANRRTLVTEPLAFHDTPLGYFAYELPPKRGQVFDALRTMISGAIQGARLVKQVQKRTEELEVANLDLSNTNQKVRDILENIEQALFTVNLDGSVNRESSRSVRTVLGIDDPSRAELRDLLHLTREQEKDFVAWLGLVEAKHAAMRWEKLTRLAPVQDCEIVVDGATRYIRIRYQRMFDSRGTLDKIMVLAVDETESRRVEQLIAAQREQHENEVKTIIGLVHNLPESIADYLADADARVRRVQERFHGWLERAREARAGYPNSRPFLAEQDEVTELGRDLHTLKGNSATYGFERISKISHEAEDLLEALKPPVEVRSTTTLEGLAAKADALAEALADVERTRRRLSDSDSGAMIRVPESKIDGIRELAASLAARDGADSELKRLLDACAGLRDIPLARLADKYRKLVERLGARLGKSIELVVDPVDLDLDPHFFSPIDEALVHILRNSVDHGLEIPEDRRDAGKPETGRIAIEVELRPGATVVRVRDDGRGIDVNRVIAKAIEKGMVTAEQVEAMSDEERLGLVFRSGVSTAAAVSEISGRGVGMDAVRDCLAKLGGSIRVTSGIGLGSCMELTIPA